MNPLHGVERWDRVCWRARQQRIRYMELKEYRSPYGLTTRSGTSLNPLHGVERTSNRCPAGILIHTRIESVTWSWKLAHLANCVICFTINSESVTWSWKGYLDERFYRRIYVESVTWSWKVWIGLFSTTTTLFSNPLHGVESSTFLQSLAASHVMNPLHGVERYIDPSDVKKIEEMAESVTWSWKRISLAALLYRALTCWIRYMELKAPLSGHRSHWRLRLGNPLHGVERLGFQQQCQGMDRG